MNKYPEIYLYNTLDTDTLRLIDRIYKQLKIYRNYKEYRLFGDLVRKRININEELQKIKFDAATNRLNIIFSSKEVKSKFHDKGELLEIDPKSGVLRLKFYKENSVQEVDTNQVNFKEMYLRKEEFKDKGLVINWNENMNSALRELMYLSYILEWHELRFIIIKGYNQIDFEVLYNDIEIFLKGVLTEFEKEKFIFHPFR